MFTCKMILLFDSFVVICRTIVNENHRSTDFQVQVKCSDFRHEEPGCFKGPCSNHKLVRGLKMELSVLVQTWNAKIVLAGLSKSRRLAGV